MEKLNYLKFGAIILALLILVIPQHNPAWKVVIITSAILLMIWSVKKFGWLEAHKIFTIGFIVIALLTETGTKLHKWMVFLAILSAIFWLLKKYIFKE